MIAMGTNPLRRQRAVACLSVAVASLLCASGTVLTERLADKGLSEILGDALRSGDDEPVVAGVTEEAAPSGSGGQAPANAGTVGNPAPGAPAISGGSGGSGSSGASVSGGTGSGTKGSTGKSGAKPGTTKPATGSLPVAAPGTGTGGGTTPAPGGGTTDPGASDRHPLEVEADALKPFVEREAGHTFKGPVAVAVMSDAAFTTRLAELNWLPKGAAAEQLEATYRSLGIIDPSVDLPTELAKFTTADVVTLYDAVAGRLLVRDREANPYLRLMMVRELTRALDDQHFDIYRDNNSVNDEVRDGLKAIAEGDAVRVQDKYLQSLTGTDRTRAEAEKERIAGQTPSINPAVMIRFTYAVAQGVKFVQALLEAGGRARLDQAFAAPPVTSEQVLHPERYLAGEGAKPPADPAADGAVLGRGTMGQIGLFMLLGSATDSATATRAAQGWGGDRFVTWQAGAASCTRMTIAMDSPQDNTELGAALAQWAQKMPGAEVTGAGPFTIKRCV